MPLFVNSGLTWRFRVDLLRSARANPCQTLTSNRSCTKRYADSRSIGRSLVLQSADVRSTSTQLMSSTVTSSQETCS
jgi:hypothetical protein